MSTDIKRADDAHRDAPSQRTTHERTFVGRGGLKLDHALHALAIDVRGLVCADFGCNVGGFTDCLLQRGAAKILAVDTGYAMLAWKLRQDSRVVVMERTNALHAPSPDGGVEFIAMDMGWTPQRHAVPAALRWLRPGGMIVTLIKPHYEATDGESRAMQRGVLDEGAAAQIVERVCAAMPELGAEVIGVVRSPIAGGGGKKSRGGNAEWLAALRPLR